MEAIARDYTPKGVRFYYIYKTLAHPDWNNYATPFTIKERLMHVAEARRSMGTSIPWLCDQMDGRFTKAMGNAPNSEFIIGPKGSVVKRHGWNDPQRLRGELVELVGPVDKPTDPAYLKLPTPIPLAAAATGIVPRIKRPESMTPVQLKPVAGKDGNPFYAKLRAEVTGQTLRKGNGTLYLGFLLDPLYKVHWNNLVAPIQVEVTGPETVELKRASQSGPKVKVAADADPREFLVKLKNWQPEDTLTVTVRYFACNDEAGWCKPVQQTYEIQRKRARGAGFSFRPEYRQRMIESLNWRDGGVPPQRLSATTEQITAITGQWKMNTDNSGSNGWTLNIEHVNGKLRGWSTFDQAEPKVDIISFDGKQLRFLQLAGPSPEQIVVRLDGDRLTGTHLSVFGDFEVYGRRKPAKPESPPTEAKGTVLQKQPAPKK